MTAPDIETTLVGRPDLEGADVAHAGGASAGVVPGRPRCTSRSSWRASPWCSRSSGCSSPRSRRCRSCCRTRCSFWPAPWTLDNYVEAWNAVPFAQAYLNSIYICVLAVVGTLLTASMAGYAFARIRFRGSRVHLHRVPRDADDPEAGHADPVLPADEPVRLGRLPPLADRARRCW